MVSSLWKRSAVYKPVVDFNISRHTTGTAANNFQIDDDRFEFCGSFGEMTQVVEMPLLSGGAISTSFGDYTVDFSGVTSISPNCVIDTTCSFGNTTILVPSRFEVRCCNSVSFANVDLDGEPDTDPVGTIKLNITANFGEVSVTYI